MKKIQNVLVSLVVMLTIFLLVGCASNEEKAVQEFKDAVEEELGVEFAETEEGFTGADKGQPPIQDKDDPTIWQTKFGKIQLQDVTVIVEPGVLTEYDVWISGKVTNLTGQDISYLQLLFTVYDGTGNEITGSSSEEHAFVTTAGFPDGSTWEFKGNVTDYVFQNITDDIKGATATLWDVSGY